MWSFVFRVSSVVKCLFTSFAHYFIGWFFYYWVRRVLRICIYILGASPLRDVAVQLLSHFQIFCNPMDCSWQGSFVHGILQARILEWVAIFFYRGSSQPRDRTCASCLLYWQAGSWPLAPGGKPFLVKSIVIVVIILKCCLSQQESSFFVSCIVIRPFTTLSLVIHR